ncbi:uncharacterized protein LOC113549351 [Rhopalosiphum maidis]|uniref:uncharacterized protein LOC113549351 n=1 Tax=Rhopalosiphum maidis TaxID=43146 RepID=UPI000F002BBF|nr:uncharacterized protein LOC113549351 [Rhopalosiphum maidis]
MLSIVAVTVKKVLIVFTEKENEINEILEIEKGQFVKGTENAIDVGKEKENKNQHLLLLKRKKILLHLKMTILRKKKRKRRFLVQMKEIGMTKKRQNTRNIRNIRNAILKKVNRALMSSLEMN